MKRFTIWRDGRIMGTHPGNTEQEALDDLAKSEGYSSFDDFCAKTGKTRDDHKVKDVEKHAQDVKAQDFK